MKSQRVEVNCDEGRNEWEKMASKLGPESAERPAGGSNLRGSPLGPLPVPPREAFRARKLRPGPGRATREYRRGEAMTFTVTWAQIATVLTAFV
jgi:hypothetical protein